MREVSIETLLWGDLRPSARALPSSFSTFFVLAGDQTRGAIERDPDPSINTPTFVKRSLSSIRTRT